MTNALHVGTTTYLNTHLHYELVEPVPYVPVWLPGPPFTNHDITRVITRVMVALTTTTGYALLDDKHDKATLTCSLRSGRYVMAGVGVNPHERDDTLLDMFADLIADARARAAHPAVRPVHWDNSLDEVGEGADVTRNLAPVVHAGPTRYEPAPTDPRGPLGPIAVSLESTHTCRHGDQVWSCACAADDHHNAIICPNREGHRA